MTEKVNPGSVSLAIFSWPWQLWHFQCNDVSLQRT